MNLSTNVQYVSAVPLLEELKSDYGHHICIGLGYV